MPRARIGTVLLAAWIVAGDGACQNGRWPVWGAAEAQKTDGANEAPTEPFRTPLSSSRLPSSGRPTVVELHFDVMRVDLPCDSVRHSAKLWNHVDELRVEPAQSVLLGRNGIRMGVAPADAWPAMQAVLEAHGARASRRQHAVQAGYPLTLEIGDVQEGETIFSYDGQGGLKGRTFGAGHKYIHLDYVVEADDPPRVLLRATPEVHVRSADRRWQDEDGEYVEKPVYEGYSYTMLSAAVSMTPGQILVLGPGPQAAMAHLLGNRFFERIEAGVKCERLYFATPQLFRSETPE